MNSGSKSFSNNNMEESNFIFLYATAAVSLITIFVICVCGCRKSMPKNELLGLAGKVKLTNPDHPIYEDHNHNGGYQRQNGIETTIDEVDSVALTDSKNRNTLESVVTNTPGVATATRSLPDLPVDTNRRRSNSTDVWEKSGEQNSGGDTGSELYATVEEHKSGIANGRLNKKVSQSTNAVLERGQSGSYASPNTDDSVSPYACFKKEHPYDKVKQTEHQYAQVTSATKKKKLTRELQSSIESATSSNSSRNDEVKQPSPLPLIRNRQQSWENSGESTPHSNVVDNIPAAGAISGAVAASSDLPYMTPPIPQNEVNTPHFSGDSQDSGKGYTSISVREPLSNIARRPRIVDSSHYATVSDDSDEMYAAIDEPLQIYTSGSETYAKIAPIARPEQVSPPQLPSVHSIRSVAQSNSQSPNNNRRANSPQAYNGLELAPLHIHTNMHAYAHPPNPSSLHSRQSSSSSVISSDQANEKRQANSPLPKTPEIVDDMYAKVIKQKKKQKRSESNWSNSSQDDNDRHVSNTPSPDFVFPSSSQIKQSDPYESRNTVGYDRGNEYERIKKTNSENEEDPNYEMISKQRRSKNNSESNYDLGYERIHKHSISNDPESNYDLGYERINQKTSNKNDLESSYDLGYETIHKLSMSESDPNYERIHNMRPDESTNYDADIGYEQIHKTNSKVSENGSNYDVGYEQIHRNSMNKDMNNDSDPNYEELKSETEDYDDPNYEVLSTFKDSRKPNRNQNKMSDQNYASNNKVTEHNYASINKNKKKKYRQSEPDYASLVRNYENNNESTYECMNDCFIDNESSSKKFDDEHKGSTPVSRIEVEPNVFYSQVQKHRDKR